MLRIFRHYIPKTLVLLGLAELLILFVSIYLGATFHIGSETVPKTLAAPRRIADKQGLHYLYCFSVSYGMSVSARSPVPSTSTRRFTSTVSLATQINLQVAMPTNEQTSATANVAPPTTRFGNTR